MNKKNVILDKCFEFALAIIEFSEELESQKMFVIARQILKSGTSIGANVKESQSGESKQDFIHKLKIAAKEAEETEYWLLLCKHSKNYPFHENLLLMVTEIQNLLSSIISTSKQSIHYHISTLYN